MQFAGCSSSKSANLICHFHTKFFRVKVLLEIFKLRTFLRRRTFLANFHKRLKNEFFDLSKLIRLGSFEEETGCSSGSKKNKREQEKQRIPTDHNRSHRLASGRLVRWCWFNWFRDTVCLAKATRRFECVEAWKSRTDVCITLADCRVHISSGLANGICVLSFRSNETNRWRSNCVCLCATFKVISFFANQV